jgi:Alw26I/Eco31I/Esp3I family type II restriction m6 adenine DNA methyltransferase
MQVKADYSDDITSKATRHEVPIKRNDLFHRIARNLLSGVLLEIVKTTNNAFLSTTSPETLTEASRITVSNVIIAQCLHTDAEEIINNPDIGITRVSAKCSDRAEFTSHVFKMVQDILPKAKRLPAFDDISGLETYQLIKVLEAVHEVAVYGTFELLSESEIISSLRINEKSSMRKERGAFYTPVEVTEFICENTIGQFLDERIDHLQYILDKEFANSGGVMNELRRMFEMRIVDPACGPGGFLTSSLIVISLRRQRILEICEKLKAHSLSDDERIELDKWIHVLQNENRFLKYFEEHVYGVDLDPAALEIASICLSILSGRNCHLERLKWSYGVNLKEGNSLISELPPRSIKTYPEELQVLLNLRKQLKARGGFVEKASIVKKFEDIIAQILGRQISNRKTKRASQFFRDAKEKKAFCWELEFPEVFYSNKGDAAFGFDFLVMNPPYDLLKPNRLEFMRLYNVKDTSRTKNFENLRRSIEEEVRFYRKSGHYNLALANVLNLYKLMIERALIITSSTAILGFIVPSTLLCDESTGNLRKEILSKYRIKAIFDFPESARVFNGVSQAVCIVAIDKSERGEFIPLVTGAMQLDDLKRTKLYAIPIGRVKRFSSDFRIPKVTEFGWRILEKIHSNPQLSEVPWILNLRGEVDLTIYKDCLSVVNTGNILLRGNDIQRYVMKRGSGKKEGFILKERFFRKLGNSIKAKHTDERRIAGQQISNMMQRWRLKFCLAEAGTFLGNSCNYILVTKEGRNRERYLLYLLALLNSCVLNWRFKLTSTNNHVNNVELDALPIKVIDFSNCWENQLFHLITTKVKSILQNGVTKVDPEVEAAIFSLYELTAEEVRFILNSERVDESEVKDILEHFYNINKMHTNYTAGGVAKDAPG